MDERLVCLLCVFIGDITYLIYFIDPIGVHGINSQACQLQTVILGATMQVLAGAATVRLFMGIQAPFDHRTRRALIVFDILVVAFIILESIALSMTTSWKSYGTAYVSLIGAIGHGGLLIILTATASFYSLTLLKSLLAHSPTEERRITLQRSLQSLRYAQLAGGLAVLTLIFLTLIQFIINTKGGWLAYMGGISVLRAVQVFYSLHLLTITLIA
jgi:hypothetical protein